MISEDPYAIWPYHLHGAIRTALRTDDTHTPDRWTESDWHQAAVRALAALGEQWPRRPFATGGTPSSSNGKSTFAPQTELVIYPTGSNSVGIAWRERPRGELKRQPDRRSDVGGRY